MMLTMTSILIKSKKENNNRFNISTDFQEDVNRSTNQKVYNTYSALQRLLSYRRSYVYFYFF